MSVYMFLGCLVGKGLRNRDEPSVASTFILVTTSCHKQVLRSLALHASAPLQISFQHDRDVTHGRGIRLRLMGSSSLGPKVKRRSDSKAKGGDVRFATEGDCWKPENNFHD